MRLVCINNGKTEKSTSDKVSLSVGRVYIPLNESSDWKGIGIKIVNDNGDVNFYSFDRFRDIVEIRDNKLKELGI